MAFTTISNMFGASPIRPLQKHMESVQTCISQLMPFFDAVLAGDWDEARKQQAEISRLENAADDLKRELRLNMPRSLFMAMSRRDLLEVLTMQDKIANKAKDIAGLITGREMSFPTDFGPLLKDFIARSIDASAQAQKAINELDELVETGFRGNEVQLVEAMIHKLDEIESDTDTIQIKIRSTLFAMFAIETELNPVEVMFLYRIIDWIGDLGDLAQRVGSRLELMLAR
ncbi:MAG: TIGR00153 family protein [Gammaproteobacteria bacterium]|nr:TIGR00153 family protein [Gammaproteobacteria bacterium]